MNRSEFDRIANKVRNWGRWGDDDQRGTLNLVDQQALRRAGGEVTSGKLFHLGLNFDENGPQPPGGMRFNPKLYMIAMGEPMNPAKPLAYWSDDVIHMPLQAATQWDALAHVHYEEMMYNGCKACDVLSTKGAARLGVENLATPGIASRGVLLDIARLKGVEVLLKDYEITVDDLNAACAHEKVTVEPGDVVLVRTGHIRCMTVDHDPIAFNGDQPGLGGRCAEWIHDKQLAAIAADNLAVEVLSYASMAEEEAAVPLHMLCLRDMGLPLGEMFNLEALAADCAEDGRYSFLLSAAALPVTRAVGSPVNPLVLK